MTKITPSVIAKRFAKNNPTKTCQLVVAYTQRRRYGRYHDGTRLVYSEKAFTVADGNARSLSFWDFCPKQGYELISVSDPETVKHFPAEQVAYPVPNLMDFA